MNSSSKNSLAEALDFFSREFVPKLRALIRAGRPGNSLTFVTAYVLGLLLGNHRVDFGNLLSVGASQTLLYAASCYVNDLSDQKIDAINQVKDQRSLSLLSKETLHLASSVAIIGSFLVALLADHPEKLIGLLLIELSLSALYSLRPIRLSDRGFLATTTLMLAYVSAPLFLGFLWEEPHLIPHGLSLLVGIHVFQFAFLLLKDWKDVRGDRIYQKLTPLIIFGSRPTLLCATSLTVCGLSLMIATFHSMPGGWLWVVYGLGLTFLAIEFWRSEDLRNLRALQRLYVIYPLLVLVSLILGHGN